MTAEMVPYSSEGQLDTLTADPTGGRLVAWASGLSAAHKIGSALCATSFCPQHFRGKPEEAAAAILFGDEIGLTPTQALRSVHVISGTPGLYARTMVALVLSHGHRVWTVEKSDGKVTVAGQRRGSSVVEQETWTVARARTAGYTNNKKYTTDPQAMLYARAAADVCRRVAPDALAGLAYTVEELEISEPEPTVTVTRSSRTAQRAPLTTVPEPDPTPAPDTAPAAAETPTTTPEPDVDPATRAQVTRLNIQLQEAGITDRDAKLAYLSEQVRRDIASSNDLTKTEAHTLIDALDRERQAEAATDQGDDTMFGDDSTHDDSGAA